MDKVISITKQLLVDLGLPQICEAQLVGSRQGWEGCPTLWDAGMQSLCGVVINCCVDEPGVYTMYTVIPDRYTVLCC